ncbi:T3SS effector HopA1 family protein [Kitasatospora sp. NPDC093550]|uniref:T3SS effector HopA1 family protein n=1 Tax=Kitasatospora sp. NPDC093550 TaxID=3364089 RepID=UPI00381E5F0C
MSDTPVSPALLAAAERVSVLPDRTGATVGKRRLEAETPRELRRLLSDALYHELHAGLDVEGGSLPFRLRDPEFEAELAKAVPHRETTLRGVLREVGEDTHRVEFGGVIVRIPAERVVVDGESAAGAVTTGAVTAGAVVGVLNTSLRPALSPGFFMVEGTRPHRSREVLRVYVHIESWRAARPVWHAALTHLEANGVTYRSKIVSSKLLYPRRDALVVYLDQQDREAVHGLAEAVGELPGLGSDTSVFTRRIRPGVSTAWEPRDPAPGMDGLSFGQHRASVLAKALVDTADAPDTFVRVLHGHLVAANVDPADPYRNLDSLDVSGPRAAGALQG